MWRKEVTMERGVEAEVWQGTSRVITLFTFSQGFVHTMSPCSSQTTIPEARRGTRHRLGDVLSPD